MTAIDLKRVFAPLKPDAETDALDWGAEMGRRYGGWLGWDELITHRRVVLLAEANSGKTEEFRLRAAMLRESGNASFFLRVEDLADGPLLDGLAPEDEARFAAWHDSEEPGWFFLDSVDEARLNAKRFERALNRFRRDIGSALDRAHVFVSCRVSDWKGKEDLDLVASSLPVPSRRPLEAEASSVDELLLRPIFKEDSPSAKDEDSSDAKESLTIVRLAELTTEQRSALARWAGVADTEAFIREINRQGLNTLAERPGDLLELAEYWKEHGRFASFAVMTEFAIVQKLAERDTCRNDADILTDMRAREGAERIAAALTLGMSLTLRVPSQEPDPTLAVGALDPADILPDWTPLERAALLRRGVFAPATYGRVRFHHRSTQEYLTAQWLRRMLESGCPRSEVMALLFADLYGVRTAVPSMRPAAAWLALADTEVRKELLEREPLELLRHGDPRALPVSVRARLLIVYADRQSAGEVTDDSVDRRSFWMFADARLAPAIREAWGRNTDPSFRTDLLLLVREGAIADCIDLAREPASEADADRYLRYAAVSAMSACGDHEGLAHFVDTVLASPSSLSAQDAVQFALHLFPKYLSRSNLIRLIEESEPARSSGVDGFPPYMGEFWSLCPSDEHPAFLEELSDLCLTPPFLADYHRVSAKHSQLAPALAAPAAEMARSLGNKPAPLSLIKACAVIERSQEHPDRDDLLRLHDALRRQQRGFHRELFWFDVQEARRNRERDVTHWWQLGVHGSRLWELTLEDAEWLMARIRDEAALQDRQIAFSILVLILGEERLRTREGELRPLVAGVPELESALAAALSPPPLDPDAKRQTRRERIMALRDQERVAKAKQSWIDFAARIREDSSHLRDPVKLSDWSFSSDLLTLANWLTRRTGKSQRDAARLWPELVEVFGDEVAQAYRAGMKLLWRLIVPRTVNPDTTEPNTLQRTHLLSFYGVGLESDEREGWADRLTPDEAERAVLHILSVGEQAPDWIEVLARSHPERVRPIIAREAATEWASTSPVSSNFLDRIADGGDEYVLQMADLVMDLLDERPGRLHSFDIALRAVARLPQTTPVRAKLIARAKHELQTNAADNEWGLRQLALLFICDPEIGLESLEQWLEAGASDEDRKARGERAFAGLFSRHWPLAPDRLTGQPVQTLKRLVLLAYRTVRAEDDEHHEGIHALGIRDEAESARSRVLGALLGIPGRETYEALRELADAPSFALRRKRFRELAHQRAESDAELTAWTAADVVAFEKRHAAPAKSGPDLFRIARAVLDDIRTGFLHDDASSRLVLGSAKDEQAVQNWLAEQLKLRAKGRFHVHREVEVAGKKEPDIMLASTSAAVEVAVEIKHSGKGWTLRQLEFALREQLVKDYLRPGNRRHGLLVITHHRNRTWRDPDTKATLDFDHLVERLDGLAATLQRNETGPVEVAVVGLDASPRA